MHNNRPYRFLFVSAPFSGIEVHVKNLKRVISQRPDVEAQWMFVEWEPQEQLARSFPLSLNWTLKASYVVRSRIRKLMRAGHTFDAVFFNNIVLPLFIPVFRKHVPFVICLDVTPKLMEEFAPWYLGNYRSYKGLGAGLKDRLLTRSVYTDASKIISWSEMVRNSLMTHYQVPAERIDVIPPGVDLTYWNTNGTRSTNARTQVLFVGADFNRKGGDMILLAAAKPAFQGCDFHFVTKNFPGTTLTNVFVHSSVNPNSDELRALYRKADVFALPTRADFSPNVICEAMACELPVVATRVGAINEMITDGVNGHLIDVDDQSALEASLARLAADSVQRKVMGTHGRASAVKHYNMETNALRVLQMMRDAADKKNQKMPVTRRTME